MPVYKIQKRNGSIVDFNLEKIEDAINQAAKATGKHDEIVAQVLAQDVYARLEEEFSDKIPAVEEVQDIVEDMLIQYGYAETAKAYILYREK
jgi:ribonucleoside-triphosphate reductase